MMTAVSLYGITGFPKVDVSKGFHHIFDMIWFTIGLNGYEHQYTEDCTRFPPAWHPR